MPEEVIYYLTRYGYLAIFFLVFLQEVGMPNPLPNELLLIFSGYLSFTGLLFLPYVILSVVSADFIGTNLLYFLFYHAGAYLIHKKPKWLPLSEKIMDYLKSKISKRGQLNIYIFRLTPFTRGYTSVITGLLQVKPKIFLPIALISSVTWTAVYVLTGYLIAPYWEMFTENLGSFKYVMLAVFALVLCIVLLVYYTRKRQRLKTKESINNS